MSVRETRRIGFLSETLRTLKMRCLLNLTSSASQPEFIIYSFKKDEMSKGSPVWQASAIHENEADAVRKAKALFSSARFTRVEVRKKHIDSKGRIIDEAVKILDSMPGKTLQVGLFIGAAILCAAVAGILTFLS